MRETPDSPTAGVPLAVLLAGAAASLLVLAEALLARTAGEAGRGAIDAPLAGHLREALLALADCGHALSLLSDALHRAQAERN